MSFGSRGIFCLDMDGKKVWEKDLGQMQTRMGFGEGASAGLHEDTLVVPWDHEGQSYVIALEAATGEIRWQVERDERTTWATPLIVQHNGGTQVVLNGNRVRSYDLETGELLWECGGQVDNPIPSPVLSGETVVCMTGFRGNAIFAIPLDAQGDVTGSDVIRWQRTDAAPYVPSPVLYKGRLYFTKSNQGIVSSVDAETGEVIIQQQRLPEISSVYSSPVAAADRIYFTGRDGTTTVIKHGDELEVLAINKLDEGIDASPAIVGDEIYLRTENHLICVAHAETAG
jgi:outer membrane protein assembly factor BamB